MAFCRSAPRFEIQAGVVGVLTSFLSRKFELEGLRFKAKADAVEQQQAAALPAIEKLSEASSLYPSPRLAVARIENEMRD